MTGVTFLLFCFFADKNFVPPTMAIEICRINANRLLFVTKQKRMSTILLEEFHRQLFSVISATSCQIEVNLWTLKRAFF